MEKPEVSAEQILEQEIVRLEEKSQFLLPDKADSKILSIAEELRIALACWHFKLEDLPVEHTIRPDANDFTFTFSGRRCPQTFMQNIPMPAPSEPERVSQKLRISVDEIQRIIDTGKIDPKDAEDARRIINLVMLKIKRVNPRDAVEPLLAVVNGVKSKLIENIDANDDTSTPPVKGPIMAPIRC